MIKDLRFWGFLGKLTIPCRATPCSAILTGQSGLDKAPTRGLGECTRLCSVPSIRSRLFCSIEAKIPYCSPGSTIPSSVVAFSESHEVQLRGLACTTCCFCPHNRKVDFIPTAAYPSTHFPTH